MAATPRAGARQGPEREPLPIDPLLPEVVSAAVARGVVLLAAPPGSGKTTRVPPALLEALPDGGEVCVLAPRRLPARAAAARVAAELGTEVGGLVGYQVRGDRRVSRRTRVRFVTEGVLVRQLVHDPFLEGTAVVVLDEFHERHAEGDLALAMLREVRETVRPDLRLCVMSATLDCGPLRAFLPGAAELAGDGRLFPVAVEHEARRDDGPLELRVRAAVARALAATAGDVLVFLPGSAEIDRCGRALDNVAARSGAVVLPLHGRLPPAAQDAALRPHARRKIVLSTNVAESSLTIPGITAVVDSGLERQLRHDRGRGVDVLEVRRISLASAAQRAGRAGRTAAGVCYRLWTAGEERSMAAHGTPELLRVDLAAPALLVRAFAGRDPAAFQWFEPPPPAALAAADALLGELGAVDVPSGRVTAFGRELLRLPVHPRLGSVVLAGRRHGCARAAATAAALLAEVDDLGRGEGVDLLAATAALLGGAPAAGWEPRPAQVRQVLRARERLLPERAGGTGACDDGALAASLLAGFPDRVAVRAAPDRREATMVGGRGLLLPEAADGAQVVLALELRESGRQRRSLATVTAPLEEEALAAAGLLVQVATAELDEAQGRVVAVRSSCYRDLPLRSARGGEVPADKARELLLPLLVRDPHRWLGDQPALQRLLARIAFLRARMPELALPALDDGAVASAALDLLGGGTDLRALAGAPVAAHLLQGLPAAQRRALAAHAPERVPLPSGRAAAVDYAAQAGPTVRARLQEFFGPDAVPPLAGGRVPVVLELLAPNQRPVQVTTDLPSFWANVYPQVRRELQRRYPRHAWPEDPRNAPPERRPARRPRP